MIMGECKSIVVVGCFKVDSYYNEKVMLWNVNICDWWFGVEWDRK